MSHATIGEHRNSYVITGPTSGIGRETALTLAARGHIVLVGRDRSKLQAVEREIAHKGGQALAVVCDLADIKSVRRAAAEIGALRLPIAGLLNNAGVLLSRETKDVQGWDVTFTTNHLGPFALTEALAPFLADGAQIVSVVSAIEDPERKPAKIMGMQGGRYISAEASARGQWKPGGSKMPGIDAYATSKQCSLASILAWARETPRLRFNAVEPGINPSTALGGANAFLRFLFGQVITRLPRFSRYRSTPRRAARVVTKILTEPSVQTGVYFDEKGAPMRGSALAHDPEFQDRIVAETRALLATV